MQFFDGFAEFAAIDMGVDLGGCDVRVAKEVLDNAEVRASSEQVGCEGMAEHVGMDLVESGLLGAVFDDLPDADALDGSACTREEQSALIASFCGAFCGDEHRSAFAQVLIECFDRGGAHRDDAVFVTFAQDSDDPDAFFEIGQGDVPDLAGAESGGVHEFEDCAVAEVEGGLAVGFLGRLWCAQEFFDLVGREDAWEFLPFGGLVEVVGGVVCDFLVCVEPAVEDLDGRDVSRDGGPCVAALFGERSDVGDEVLWEGVVGVVDASGLEVDEEGFKVSGVRFDGRGEEAALDADEVDEATADQLVGL